MEPKIESSNVLLNRPWRSYPRKLAPVYIESIEVGRTSATEVYVFEDIPVPEPTRLFLMATGFTQMYVTDTAVAYYHAQVYFNKNVDGGGWVIINPEARFEDLRLIRDLTTTYKCGFTVQGYVDLEPGVETLVRLMIQAGESPTRGQDRYARNVHINQELVKT